MNDNMPMTPAANDNQTQLAGAAPIGFRLSGRR
jgi:hypothetical protein